MKIKLRYLEFQDDHYLEILLLDNDKMLDLKIKALKRIGIIVKDGEKPICVWFKYLSELNNLPYTVPCHRDLREAIKSDKAAMKFLWFIT